MKIHIVYFSGTGNTMAVAKAYGKQLEHLGHDVKIDTIEGKQSIEPHDFLIVGGPIYAGNMPHELIQWVRRHVPKSNGPKKAIVFSTSAVLGNAHGVKSIAKKLIKKGYEITDAACFEMPRNFYIERYDPTPEADQIRQFKQAAEMIVQSIETMGKATTYNVTSSVIMIDMLADIFAIMAKSMGKKFEIDETCIQCGICEKNCPKENITVATKTYHNRCILCTRCIHSCPVGAISYKGKKIEPYRVPYEIKI